jgi:hypothetical protein
MEVVEVEVLIEGTPVLLVLWREPVDDVAVTMEALFKSPCFVEEVVACDDDDEPCFPLLLVSVVVLVGIVTFEEEAPPNWFTLAEAPAEELWLLLPSPFVPTGFEVVLPGASTSMTAAESMVDGDN